MGSERDPRCRCFGENCPIHGPFDDEPTPEVDRNPPTCRSTHGSMGYAPDSYWEGDAIVCGWCGERIEYPPPTGTRNGNPSWPEWIRKETDAGS